MCLEGRKDGEDAIILYDRCLLSSWKDGRKKEEEGQEAKMLYTRCIITAWKEEEAIILYTRCLMSAWKKGRRGRIGSNNGVHQILNVFLKRRKEKKDRKQ